MCAFRNPTTLAWCFLIGLTLAAIPGIGACIQTRELFGTVADAGVVTDAGMVTAAPGTGMDAPQNDGSCPGRIEMIPDGCPTPAPPSDDAFL